MRVPQHERSKDNLQKSVLSLYHVASGIKLSSAVLAASGLYLHYHLTGPGLCSLGWETVEPLGGGRTWL